MRDGHIKSIVICLFDLNKNAPFIRTTIIIVFYSVRSETKVFFITFSDLWRCQANDRNTLNQ